MDILTFNSIVKNYTCLKEDEFLSIQNLSQRYPYCQLIQMLEARAAQDLHQPDKDKILHYAAVYSSERAVLKQVMTAPRQERILIPTPACEPLLEETAILEEIIEEEREQLIDDFAPPEPEIIQVEKPKAEKTLLSGDALRDDIYFELEKLQKLKKAFEISFEEFQKSGVSDASSKSKLKQSKEPSSDPLIEEIKTTKKKLKIDNPKQKEQNEIIDQFIKIQPSIPKAKLNEPASDLAEDSGMFSDNIVSETLVDILLKQGKKDKAIEVLKKLIWKFPQKKAYFADQIDRLKN